MKIYSKFLIIGLIILFVGVSYGVSFEPLSCDANGPYKGNIMEDIEFDSSVTGGIPPYDYFWEYGDGNTSSGDPHPTHNYANAGNYTVILTVTDSVYDTATDTTWAYINAPPNIPVIDGSYRGKPGIEYEYTFNSTDQEGESVMYYVDWGDNNTVWTEYSNSGEEIVLKHTWDEKGEYKIKAKAKDINDAESDWSEFEVTIPRTKISSNTLLLQSLKHFPILERLLNIIF